MEVLEILGSPVRVRVIQVLLDKGPLNHADLLQELDLPVVTIYTHLQKMTKAGVLEKEEDDRRTVLYKVRKEALKDAKDFITGWLEKEEGLCLE